MSYEDSLPELPDGESQSRVIRLYDTAEAFQQLNAQQWIAGIRVEGDDGLLDIDSTADRLGVPVVREMPEDPDQLYTRAVGRTVGLGEDTGKGPLTVHLDPDQTKHNQRQTYGHELGHIFLEKVGGLRHSRVDGPHRVANIERFCEFFGVQMALPVDHLKDINFVDVATVASLMEKYDLDHMAVLQQLMLAGKVPRRILIDSGIGEVPNQFYSGMVERRCVCLDCTTGREHDIQAAVADYNTPVYDFTTSDWSHKTPYISCGRAPKSMDLFVEVNKLHGRWTVQHDILLPEETARIKSYREAAGLSN